MGWREKRRPKARRRKRTNARTPDEHVNVKMASGGPAEFDVAARTHGVKPTLRQLRKWLAGRGQARKAGRDGQ